jgi:hypothetical protein
MLGWMSFRDRLLETLRCAAPVLSVPDVLVGGSEIPNILERGAASSLVISEDVDIIVPVKRHAEVKSRLGALHGLRQSTEEPSVFLPTSPNLIEVNFVGSDPDERRIGEAYVLEDPVLPLLVFGNLSLLQPAEPIVVDGLRIPVPRPAGLMLEKLVTDRSGTKGDRDLLVVLGLLIVSGADDLDELLLLYRTLPAELRYHVRANLSLLSLLEPIPGMPNPEPHRARLAALLSSLETAEGQSQ